MYAVVYDKTAEGMGAVGREVDVEASVARLLLIGRKNGAGVLGNGDVDGTKKSYRIKVGL